MAMGLRTSIDTSLEKPRSFYDGGGGGGGGLDLCTESLGSESCDGGLEPEEMEALLEGTAWAAADTETEHEDDDSGLDAAWRRRERKMTVFPPPLRWMAGADGRRTGIIRAERRDGRLVLTQVRIERPEVYRATREGGRLRLHAVGPEGYEEEEEEEEMEVEGPPAAMEENEEWREWQRGGAGEGFRRCQEPVNGNHEVPAWWHHRFVTIA